jgi:hypothetical protein
MGWPFLWPAEEPWPLCNQRNPEMALRLEAGLGRAEAKGIDTDGDRLELPAPREMATLLIERNAYLFSCRNCHAEFDTRVQSG